MLDHLLYYTTVVNSSGKRSRIDRRLRDPLFEVLEARDFQALLVDPGKMSRNGRPKSDVHDCQGLQRLHTYGLLSACFRPEDQVVVLRSYLRQRAALLADAARDIQRMQQALT